MSEATPTTGRPLPRWSAIALALVLIASALAVTQPWQRDRDARFGIVDQVRSTSVGATDLETSPSVGKLAPNFLLRTFDGQTMRLSDLRGTPVFINFWATWCLFCLSEMPAMQQLADRYEGQLVVVGINVGETVDDAQPYAQRNNIRYPLLLDPETTVTEAYGVRAMPTSLFVDADGVVQIVHYGVLTPPQMEETIQSLTR